MWAGAAAANAGQAAAASAFRDSLLCELTLTEGRQEAAKTSTGQEDGPLFCLLI